MRTGHAHHHDVEATALHDRIEFRILIAVAMVWFLLVAIASRLLPRGWRPLAGSAPRHESLFAEARRTAYTVIPYAFMR